MQLREYPKMDGIAKKLSGLYDELARLQADAKIGTATEACFA